MASRILPNPAVQLRLAQKNVTENLPKKQYFSGGRFGIAAAIFYLKITALYR
jgi:hypothetical protein